MANRTFALLVGINDYSPAVGRLRGCLNDVDHFHDFLKDHVDDNSLHVEVLKDADATRDNIINQFRTHLAKADSEDTVVFQYCGHGARWKSAEPFKQFYPDGKDEGLVCHDSRGRGGYDLADKELAVLLSELAKNDPHIAVILDCCHSGSATRDADSFTQLKARQTHEVMDERPLESYLNGHYAALRQRGESLEIPASRHILLAACQRTQKAWESKDHSGVFTSTLLEVLDQSAADVTYADLFVRCRAAVRKRADNQNPQFETYRSFNAFDGFLGRAASHRARRYSVYFESDCWRVDCGALHGLPSDPDKEVRFALYPESDRSFLAGYAETTQVGPQKSSLTLSDFESETSVRYQAEITSLPVPPMLVYLDGDPDGTDRLRDFFNASIDRSLGFSFVTDEPQAAEYALIAEDASFLLKRRETGQLIQGARGYTQTAAEYMFSVLKKVAAWERANGLQNQATKMDAEDVNFKFVELLAGDEEYVYPDQQITVDICKEDGEWSVVRGKLKADNRTNQPLHLALIHASEDFAVQVLYNERVEPTDSLFTVTLDGNSEFNLALAESEGDETVHTFKLLVSTEKVDDFLLGQEPLELGQIVDPGSDRGLSFGSPRKKLVHKHEWFTKDLHVRLVRQLDRVGDTDRSLCNGQITIKGHSSLRADVSLTDARATTRGVGTDIYRALERQGIEMLNISATRGENANILELTDIQIPDSLQDDPLQIEMDFDLGPDEYILPLSFDGEHILLTGEPSKDERGRTHIDIRQLPEVADNRRSLGKALKLYFFKTYLSRKNVNKLCWVEYKSDGTVERHDSGVAEKVAAAQNILLLIHGIIGDTQGIAEGLRQAADASGTTIDQKFDLILTYDYENLSTPISKTALVLKQQLTSVGLHEHDDKRLTLLVHSMGGLVSRWFIEQEGGHKVVDHLVMVGTPNNGSPFGKVESGRQIANVLTTIAINSLPAFAPFGAAALLSVLFRSQKVTSTLEQMNPSSDFFTALNASDDPGVPYTIVAGDVRNYQDESGEFVAQLITKVGRGTLFDTLYRQAGHDIAVSVDSILGVTDIRTPAPRKENVVCHHLNYFVSEAGLTALAAVEW